MALALTLAGCGGTASPQGKVDEALALIEQMTAELDGVRSVEDAAAAAKATKPKAIRVRQIERELEAAAEEYEPAAYGTQMRRLQGAIRRLKSELHRATLLNVETHQHLAVVVKRLE